MSYPVIKVENLSKSYNLTHKKQISYRTIGDVVSEKLKNTFSFRNNESKSKENFLALNDVSFEVYKGDRVGVIGRNGAGKSTLLKILSRIISPTKGRLTIEGRVASLLEVGTGFHPELTGRENVFLNGSILGMSRSEILKKFNEIVEFAEVEQFLDTPVKRYSSGMYVRLAFAVAAHLEPEILIVDEVLAVGDALFQKKCLGKMEEVSSSEGRTILFVSHNMSAIQKLCNKGILLNKGSMQASGDIETITTIYLNSGNYSESFIDFETGDADLNGYPIRLQIENNDGELINEIETGTFFQIRVRFKVNKPTSHFIIAVGLKTTSDFPIRTSFSNPCDIEPGTYEAVFLFNDVFLASGTYPVVLGLSSHEKSFFYQENIANINISEFSKIISDKRVIRNKGVGLILNPIDVKINKVF
jgi:lipopolysaccharide transport system ATP-binding protein